MSKKQALQHDIIVTAKVLQEEWDGCVETTYGELDAKLKKRGINLAKVEANTRRHILALQGKLLGKLAKEDRDIAERALCYTLFSVIAERTDPREAPREAVRVVAFHQLGLRPPAKIIKQWMDANPPLPQGSAHVLTHEDTDRFNLQIELMNNFAVLLSVPKQQDGDPPSVTLWKDRGESDFADYNLDRFREFIEIATGKRTYT